jgi:hypothetical protein
VRKHIAVAAVLIAVLAIPGRAQEQKPASTGFDRSTIKLQVVLGRYQSEKKVSSLPYTLTVTIGSAGRNAGRGNLRLGTQVPITTMSRQNGDSNAPLVPTVQYKDVGTNIDCLVTALEDGRFSLDLTVEDSSIEAITGTATAPHPAFRSFRTSDSLLLRDAQSAQYSAATDKVSGDVWKVDVTLNVVK